MRPAARPPHGAPAAAVGIRPLRQPNVGRPVGPAAEPLNVAGHNLRDHVLKLQQILDGQSVRRAPKRRRLRLGSRRPYRDRADRLERYLTRPAPSSAGSPSLLGQNVLGQIVGWYLNAILRRLGVFVERRNHIHRA